VYLVQTIAEQRITTVHFVPSMLQVLVAERGLGGCPDLRRVLCGGEALPAQLPALFFAQCGAELYNQYGPTEATIDVTFDKCERVGAPQSVSIGRPISNTQIYVLDALLQPVGINVAGELHIGGVSLARGYGQRAELTAEKFVPDPLSGVAGARLYKTGDLARYRPGGELEYLGRMDQQVKLRGYRIELQEIEEALRRHAGIGEAIVLLHEDVPGSKRLVGYYVAGSQGETPRVEELRLFLREKLPEYMVPATLIGIDELPLTPSGKVDRRALPAPEQTAEYSEKSLIAPRTPTEERLAEIWKQLLSRDEISINQNFFDLGGHSLLATQVMSRIREAFKIELPLRFIFELPTISSLAAKIDAGTDSRGTDIDQIAQMLEEIENFSSDEITKLMEDRLTPVQVRF
jgi:acyl-coenzyme A synthetase/AMP-(fatty) acid ligase/acyl carrier protein